MILIKNYWGKAGYFGKLVLLSTRTLSMSTEVSDCGTKHLVAYDVTSKQVLKKLSGKYYKLSNDPNEELKLLNFDTDKDLIGRTIYVRSAVTCALGGNKVCAKCVGATAVTNQDIADKQKLSASIVRY